MINKLLEDWGVPVLLAVLVCASLYGSYLHGYSVAEAEGLAALNQLKVEREEERRAASDAYGAALAARLAEYQGQVARANTLAAQLDITTKALTNEAQKLRRQIKNATAGSAHNFNVEFVRLWNKAIGATDANFAALPAANGAGAADAATGAGASLGSRILSGVTEADVLAHITYYGERCQRLEAQLLAWISLMEALQDTREATYGRAGN